MSFLELHTALIKNEALKMGFSSIGIAKADFLEQEAQRLEQWLKMGFHGEMQYMENHFDKRLDPRLLVDGAKSVVVLSYNYFPQENLNSSGYKIARYAYGEDYHTVVKNKLHLLLKNIQNEIGAINARVFIDSAPVMERVWAQKAGLGWQGKNTLLIQKNKGSYYFLAVIILDLPLMYDQPFTTDHCGSCKRCVEACPTQAILSNEVVEARKCISYFTIELKNEIPASFKNKWEDWIFGCDICQEVCPWNRFSLPHTESAFLPVEKLKHFTQKDWEEITQEVFQKVFKNSAVKRTKLTGLQRNIKFVGE